MLKSKVASLIVGAVVLGGGAVAYGQTQPADPSTGDKAGAKSQVQECRKAHRENPDAAPSAECQALKDKFEARGDKGRKGHRPPMGAWGKGIHGEILVKDGDGFSTIIFDRGKVTSAVNNVVTLERADGESVSVTVDGDTKYHGIDGFDSVRVGDPIAVVTKAGKTVQVAQRPAGAPAGPPESNVQDSALFL